MAQFSSATQSCLTLWPRGLQHPRPPCPSIAPGVCSNSCSTSQRCHSTISSSVVPFSSYPQSFPASGSFPMSQFFESGGQSFGVPASASVLPINIQSLFPLGLTGLTSLQSKELSRDFSNTTVQNHQFFGAKLYSLTLTSIHDNWKTIALTRWNFVSRAISLFFILFYFLIFFGWGRARTDEGWYLSRDLKYEEGWVEETARKAPRWEGLTF